MWAWKEIINSLNQNIFLFLKIARKLLKKKTNKKTLKTGIVKSFILGDYKSASKETSFSSIDTNIKYPKQKYCLKFCF